MIALESQSSNLVSGDGNRATDAFVLDCPELGIASYCTSKVNSQGCVPRVVSSGYPSATEPDPFLVDAVEILNNKAGLLFYGDTPASNPFQGGTKCIANPVTRTPVQLSAGNPPPEDCSGAFSLDFNERIRSGVDPTLVSGAVVHVQYWYRDPASASTTGLTDALAFTILP